jgi:hypothetical protein
MCVLNVGLEHVDPAVWVVSAAQGAVAEDFTYDHLQVEIGQQALGYLLYASEPDLTYLIFGVVSLAVPFAAVGVLESVRDVPV